MKNKLKRSNNPDPRSGRLGKAIRHLLRLTGFALLLILLLTLFSLLTLGIPDPLTRRITAGFQKNGIPLCIESIRLSPHRGWVLHHVRLYSHSPDDIEPILQTEKLYLQAWPTHWITLSRSGWNIALYSKKIDVSFGSQWEDSLNEGHPFRTLNQMKAHLHIDRNGVSLSNAELLWGGFMIHAAGQAAFPKKTSAPVASPSNPALQTYATRIAKMLSELTFKTPPKISLRFNIPTADPNQITLDASFSAAGLHHRGQIYDQISGALNLHNQRLTLNALQLTQSSGKSLSAFGSFDLKNRLDQLSLNNSLPADALLTLLPESAAIELARTGLTFSGPVNFDAKFGPASPENLFKTVHANIHELQVTRNNLTLDPLRLDLHLDGDQLELSDIQAQANGHPLSGKFEINLSSLAWRTSLQGAVLPGPIGTLTGGGLQKFIQRFSFPGPPPNIQVNLSHSGKKGSLQVTGNLSGTHLLCAGIPLDSMETSIAYSNNVLVINGLRVAHENKRFAGDIRVNFKQKRANFDATTSFNPQTITHILAPEHPTILTNFTFTGPVKFKGHGQIDYSGAAHHSFDGTFTAKDVSMGQLKSDLFSGQIEERGNQLIFTNTSLQLFNGQAKGSATFDLQFKENIAPYSINMTATQIQLQQLISTFDPNDSGRTTGLLSGTFKLNADAKQGFWNSATGSGTVKIEKGQLHDFLLLRGFSRLIRSMLPDFSLFSITTFYSEYKLDDGELKSDNLQLGGTLFSARAHGTYSPKKGFDFIMQLEPLRQTRKNKKWYHVYLWGIDALKQGTSPLFFLLKFKLGGSLKDPKWRLNNLPAEFFDLLKTPLSYFSGTQKENEKTPVP